MDVFDLSSHLQDPFRLAALRATFLLDTEAEQAFDRWTRLAADLVKAPVALITLIDAHRQFFKSSYGLDEPWRSQRETPLSHSFCQYALHDGQPLVVGDARTHPWFKDNPAIRDLNFIAYLGVPLVAENGSVFGALCVIDRQPRTWSEEAIRLLEEFAVAVMTEIRLRTALAERQADAADPSHLAPYQEAGRKIVQELGTPETNREVWQGISNTLQATVGLDFVVVRLGEDGGVLFNGWDGRIQTCPLRSDSAHAVTSRETLVDGANGKFALPCFCSLLFTDQAGSDGQALRDSGVFWTNDTAHLLSCRPSFSPRATGCRECFGEEYASLALIPIRIGKSIVGLIQLGDRRKDRFSPAILTELETIARHIGASYLHSQALDGFQYAVRDLEKRVQARTMELAIANQQLLAEMEERKRVEKSLKIQRDFHSMLREGNQALLLNRDLQSIIAAICRVAVQSGHFHLVSVGVPGASGRIVFLGAAGQALSYLDGLEISIHEEHASGRGPTGACIRNNCIVVNDDFADNLALLPWRERALQHGLRSSVAIPIREGGHCYGAITFYSQVPSFFNSERVVLLEQLASNLSSSLDLLHAERQQNEHIDSLQRSEEKYRIVADNTYDWEFWLGPDGQYLYVSPACTRITGHTPEDFVARPDLLVEILHPDDMLAFLVHRHDAQQCPGPGALTFRILRPDGQLRWIEHVCQPVFASDGRFLGTRGSNRDISERKAAEEALSKSEEKYRTLFNNSEIAMFRSRLDGSQILDCNQKFLDLLGRTRDEVLHIAPREHWVDQKEREAIAGKILADGSVTDCECQILRKNNEIRTCVTSLRLYRETGIIEGSVADITERRRGEQQILQSKKRLQAVFDGIPEPMILIDGQKVVRMVNLAAARYFQVETPQEIIGTCYCQNADCHDKGQCMQCLDPEVPFASDKISFVRAGYMDPARVESVTVFPITAEDGDGAGLVIRISDITEARMMEQSLLRTQKLASIGLLSSGVAHEINNPNNFVMFNVPILRRYLDVILPIVEEHSSKQAEERLFGMSFEEFKQDLFDLTDSIGKGAERIKNIVSELKHFSSLNDPEEATWGNPKPIIEQALRIASVQMKNRIKRLEIDIIGGMPSVFFESRGLEQVLVNLLINAAQACDKEEAQVSLRTKVIESPASSLAIDIIDNGCGIDDKDLMKIFDPFFTTKAPGEGTGLGLYVCHNLIEKMGGRIEVTTTLGSGSTFRLVLPCRY